MSDRRGSVQGAVGEDRLGVVAEACKGVGGGTGRGHPRRECGRASREGEKLQVHPTRPSQPDGRSCQGPEEGHCRKHMKEVVLYPGSGWEQTERVSVRAGSDDIADNSHRTDAGNI